MPWIAWNDTEVETIGQIVAGGSTGDPDQRPRWASLVSAAPDACERGVTKQCDLAEADPRRSGPTTSVIICNVRGAIMEQPRGLLHIALWVVQLLLALAFGGAGLMKSSQPIDALVQNGMVWAADVPTAMVRFIGISELLGALGLILPAATRIRPGLTPLAACGILTIMILAMAFHLSRGEPQALPINLLLGGLAAFVAWGRTKKAPIPPRS